MWKTSLHLFVIMNLFIQAFLFWHFLKQSSFYYLKVLLFYRNETQAAVHRSIFDNICHYNFCAAHARLFQSWKNKTRSSDGWRPNIARQNLCNTFKCTNLVQTGTLPNNYTVQDYSWRRSGRSGNFWTVL